MTKNILKTSALAAAMLLFTGAAQAVVQDVVTNGDFETGTTAGWLEFANNGTISVGSPNSPLGPAGNNSALLSANFSPNPSAASFPILKLERLAEGLLTNGAAVTVSFDAYSPLQTVDINAGNNVGNVVFIAEFFTELTGDNGAVNQILVGPPTWLTNSWQHFEFNTTLGPDAGGGLSLLFKADCGGNLNCRFDAYIDNVSIVTDVAAVPVPAAVWLFGSGLLGLIGVARRKKAA
jgi:hypothetical protein